MTKAPAKLNNENDLKLFLATNYMTQIKNFFGNEKQAMKFLSSVVADVQRNPKLLECTPPSIINSYIMMAQLGFMPSGISGESYVLPYSLRGVQTAQLQVGYQGLVTLFYKAGVTKITAAVVRKNDKATLVNGEVTHEVDMNMSQEERGEIIGAYVTVVFRGEKSTKYMNNKDIIAHASKFSKSYDPTGKYSPWNPANDPEGWMKMKTVLKQMSKLLPKNEGINQAIAIDNADSILADRLPAAMETVDSLKMGALLKTPDAQKPPEVVAEQSFAEEVEGMMGEAATYEDIK